MIELTEAQVQNQCLCYLSIRKIFHWRQNTGSFQMKDRYIQCGIKGMADIIGILPDGRFLSVEVKRTKGGRVSPEQEAFRKKVEDNGGVALIVNSVEALKQGLEEAGY